MGGLPAHTAFLKVSMSLRTICIAILAGFCLLCGGLVIESGVLQTIHASARGSLPLLQTTTEVQGAPASAEPNRPDVNNVPEKPAPPLQVAPGADYGAIGGTAFDVNIPLGAVDPASGFKYRLVLDSKGAAVRTATFSEFDDRGRTPPVPLTFLSPVEVDGRQVMSMTFPELTLLDQERRLRLDELHWKIVGTQKLEDGTEEASFEATIVDPQDRPVLKLTKTYRVRPGTYMFDMVFRMENLTEENQKVQYVLTGPVGLEREGARTDMRGVVAGFRDPDGQVIGSRLAVKALAKAQTLQKRSLQPRDPKAGFLWAAAVNKYFAAIVVPTPEDQQPYVDWIGGRWGTCYNPGREDETVGVSLTTLPVTLSPAGQNSSAKTYPFQIYLGPKDKSRFDKNPLYRRLGFVQTISFIACCCPSSIINPLAFGILAIMNWMHGFWPHNYGIVIIILVFVMRLLLHPVTKKSQISMHKMSKMAPRAEEIKKKYANNKAEMNKKLMELYREQGASPIMGMLPMFVQMPIWIALWSAIYTSIDLRGAPFLPFWITDLSAPDALLSWTPFSIPFLGWHIASLNLLPLLMGVAFYLQQKLMPTQASAASNPQMAQQQKMMNVMMPLLFPLMLYNAPSGVNLYIMSSTFAGVIEQYVIKKHIREKEQAEATGVVAATSKTGGKTKKKKPKPFFRT
jgi:YidC/Oxa1 family membrane protein insertase